MSKPSTTTTLMKKILRPLVRLLLRNGVAFADFSDVARQVFVEVASQDFSLPGRKQSVSRISILTGINRKEVKRQLEEPEDNNTTPKENNRAARVIGGWMRDTDFLTAKGKPGVLSLKDNDSTGSFEDLVKRYSGDMTPRAVLDELLRVGVVSIDKNKTKVKLLTSGYVPAASKEELLKISGDSINDLLNTIDHNFATEDDLTRLQLRVAYDDVPAEGVELIRNLSTEKSIELLQSLDKVLAKQDRSINTGLKGTGRYRTGLGIYYFEEPINEHGESDDDKK